MLMSPSRTTADITVLTLLLIMAKSKLLFHVATLPLHGLCVCGKQGKVNEKVFPQGGGKGGC